MGPPWLWRRQQRRAAAVEECPADPGFSWGFIKYCDPSANPKDWKALITLYRDPCYTKVYHVCVEATQRAFAAIRSDGSVVTWGDRDAGGHSNDVQKHLKSVAHIQATYRAFAAICSDGSVVTWGDPLCGGNSCAVHDKLQNSGCG